MLGQGTQFAPCRQSLFYAVADSNSFTVCIAMIVVSDHNEIFWMVALVLSRLSWIVEA